MTDGILFVTTFHHLVIATDHRGRFFAAGLYPRDCGGTIAVTGCRFQKKGHRFVAPNSAPTRMVAGVLIDEQRLIEESSSRPIDASGRQISLARFEERRQRNWAPKQRIQSETKDAIRKRREKSIRDGAMAAVST